ncbi:MAG: MOSC domain-containing protein YiiM [Phycisphaerales bacterium]|jgi:MOSC domain-containing protein YiiM
MPSTTTASIASLNVGSATQVEWNGKPVSTGIYKSPIEGPLRVGADRVEGDHVADLRVHGGPDKAVYAFPSEHYAGWQSAFPEADWTRGAFGENLTLTGLLESRVCLGDRFRIGSAELEIRQPRMPCFKFAIRVGGRSAIGHMIKTGHSGFYFGITREGELSAGDTLELVGGPTYDGTPGLSIAAFNDLTYANADNPKNLADLKLALASPALPPEWRERFGQRLAKLTEA